MMDYYPPKIVEGRRCTQLSQISQVDTERSNEESITKDVWANDVGR